jgi:hypothetical protein
MKQDRRIKLNKMLILILILFFLTRIIPFYFLYVKLGRFAGDLYYFWYPMGQAILNGELPYKGGTVKWSVHSIFFPYLITFSYILFKNFYSPVILFIIFDFLSLLLTGLLPIKESKHLQLLYALLPVPWFVTVFLYQEEPILVFFLLLTFYFWLKKEKSKSFLALILGVLFTKYQFLLFSVPFFLRFNRRMLLLFFSIMLMIHLPFFIVGSDPLSLFFELAQNIQAGSNIWLILRKFGFENRFLSSIILALALAFGVLTLKRMNIGQGIVWLGLLLMSFSYMGGITHLLIFFPFFCIWVLRKNLIKSFILYNLLLPISYLFVVQQLDEPHHVLTTLSTFFQPFNFLVKYFFQVGLIIVGLVVILRFYYVFIFLKELKIGNYVKSKWMKK